ncbi:hypothetical protein PUN28_016510 [Cardiocondyla obscurior]|uniref:Pescadillo homolog n=1 Tax=Cardiocondyla obscurior TaxID=286306 RepID=A0AAW2ETA0_9HYME
MVVIGKKKYESGEGAQFITRRAALRKLQLTLNDFRKLCILKGIYPREPRNRKRAQKGEPGIKILYHKKDIQFLMHEPIIWKLREYKIFNRKIGQAKAMKDFAKVKRYLSNHPTLKIDHIVKERYPTFIDALRDLDDCLTLCFLFSTFPSLAHIPRDQSLLCRRLTMEFLHAIIVAKALRKVFISIKGYYYQADIKGQTVTWIVPHHFCFQPQTKNDVDFKVMSTFVEFYSVMLGFVNYRLYHTLNLCYPPKLTNSENIEKSLVDEETYVSERISALNIPLDNLDISVTTIEDDNIEIDQFETDVAKIEANKAESEKIRKLKNLFKGIKVFINREVPREPLVFVLRCFGGEVSWDKLLFVGATFDENDETITHQIVDRSSMNKQYISRYYVQPQWVFDSVNARELLPVEKYLMGAVLPPHLSPFTDNRQDQTYIPPEERAQMDPDYKLNNQADSDEEQDIEDEEEKIEAENDLSSESDQEIEDVEENDDNDAQIAEEEEKEQKKMAKEVQLQKKKKMKVQTGEPVKESPWEKARLEKQEYRLREKMIKKKHRKLYKSMMKGRAERAKEIWLLRKKRRIHDTKEKEKRKEAKKVTKTKA